jgi:hypothetical protein
MPLFGLFPKNKDGSLEKDYKKKKMQKGSKRYTLKQSLKHSLGSGIELEVPTSHF